MAEPTILLGFWSKMVFDQVLFESICVSVDGYIDE
jgi:hypothetical protein